MMVRLFDLSRELQRSFDAFAGRVSRALARPLAFLLALGSIVAWAATGPLFGYDEQWQMVVNTGTTIVTFLMVFVLQNSTARENAAIEAKLDELIRAVPEARDELIAVEEMLGDEIAALRTPAGPSGSAPLAGMPGHATPAEPSSLRERGA